MSYISILYIAWAPRLRTGYMIQTDRLRVCLLYVQFREVCACVSRTEYVRMNFQYVLRLPSKP